MDVYFEENYWGCLQGRAGIRPGKELRLDAGFTWKGRQWRIPAVYVFEEGLVADFCGRVEPEEIRTFYERWSSRIEERLSEEEEERLCAETPFDNHFRVEAKANGEKMQTQMGCGISWCPPDLRPRDEAVSAKGDQVEESLMKAYGLEPEVGWVFWRNSFAWQENAPDSLRSLVFTFIDNPVNISGTHFRVGDEETEKNVEFIHPTTGKAYVLTVLRQESECLPDQEFPSKSGIKKWPTYFHVLHYQVKPELPAGELMIFDCAQSDTPERTEQPASGSVTVIGGADSCFVAGKLENSDTHPKSRMAYSALHYEPTETVEWKMVFQIDSGIREEVLTNLFEECKLKIQST